MNNLLEKGVLTYVESSSCFAYVLNDNSMFLPTEYKVLQGQSGSFVKCMKMLYNGKIMLYYIPGSAKPLSALLGRIDGDAFIKIVRNLLHDVVEVNSNGFLSCQSIDGDLSRIYVDTANGDVSLVYMPVAKKNYEDFFSFENELRTSLAELPSLHANLKTERTEKLAQKLADGMLGLDELADILGSGVAKSGGSSARESRRGKKCSLIAINAPVNQTITVTKDEYFIGKHPDKVDGVISFNRMISRLHCKIIYHEGAYYIIDLNSSNHTYVNKKQLTPHSPCKLENGYEVRLADSDFRVEII